MNIRSYPTLVRPSFLLFLLYLKFSLLFTSDTKYLFSGVSDKKRPKTNDHNTRYQVYDWWFRNRGYWVGVFVTTILKQTPIVKENQMNKYKEDFTYHLFFWKEVIFKTR